VFVDQADQRDRSNDQGDHDDQPLRPTAKSVARYDQVVVLTRIDRIGGKLSDPRR
jgi:hypothetical protein